MFKITSSNPLPRIIRKRAIPHQRRRIMLFAIDIRDIEDRVLERAVGGVFCAGCLLGESGAY